MHKVRNSVIATSKSYSFVPPPEVLKSSREIRVLKRACIELSLVKRVN